jgi:hypothetical protein
MWRFVLDMWLLQKSHVPFSFSSCGVSPSVMWHFHPLHTSKKTGQNGYNGGKNRKGTYPEVLLLLLLGDLEISSLKENPSNGSGMRPSVTSEARVGLE